MVAGLSRKDPPERRRLRVGKRVRVDAVRRPDRRYGAAGKTGSLTRREASRNETDVAAQATLDEDIQTFDRLIFAGEGSTL